MRRKIAALLQISGNSVGSSCPAFHPTSKSAPYLVLLVTSKASCVALLAASLDMLLLARGTHPGDEAEPTRALWPDSGVAQGFVVGGKGR